MWYEIKFCIYWSKYYGYLDIHGSGSSNERRIRGNKIFRVHLLAPWAANLVKHPKLLSVVSSLLDSKNLLIWSSDLAVKSPGGSECYGWHQDEAYADLGPHNKLVTAWVSLGETNQENGCVRYLRGSHHLGTLPHVSGVRSEDRNLVLGQVVADHCLPSTLQHDETFVCLQAGQVSFHAWRTIHSSAPNTSTSDRVGLAIRYMSADVRQSRPVVRDRVSVVMGEYNGDWFEVEKSPTQEFGKDEWAEHKLSMQREWDRRRKSKELGLLPSHQVKEEN